MGSAHFANRGLHPTGGACKSIYHIRWSSRLNDGLHSFIDETTTGPVSPPPRY